MFPQPIKCVNCENAWASKHSFSFYEQLALESCPCPRCGAYTLCYRADEKSKPARRVRLREKAAA